MHSLPFSSLVRTGFFLFVFLGLVRQGLAQDASMGFYPDSLRSANLEAKFISLKLSIDPGDLAEIGNLKAHIRIQKDSVIWCSLNSLGGIEVVRCLLTPDSVKVIERISNVVLIGDYSILEKEFQIPVRFSDLQSILLNDFFEFSGIPNPRYSLPVNTGGLLEFSLYPPDSARKAFIQSFVMALKDRKARRVQIDSPSESRSLVVQYSAPASFGQVLFSESVQCSIVYPGFSDRFSFEVLKANVEETLDFPFKVPRRFKSDER
jgi:hypothetical protein